MRKLPTPKNVDRDQVYARVARQGPAGLEAIGAAAKAPIATQNALPIIVRHDGKVWIHSGAEVFIARDLGTSVANVANQGARFLDLDALADAKPVDAQAWAKRNLIAARAVSSYGDKVPDFDEAIDKMSAGVGKIDPGSVKKEDLARMGGAPAEADEE